MDEDVHQLIRQIHDSAAQAVLYATGGGFQALSWLLTVPGASRTVLDARVPYATQALADVLGGTEPATFASPETARGMAAAAYRAAVQVAPYGTPVVGLGCSCALATDRPKRGDHKVIVAAHSGSTAAHWAVSLEKGARNRAEEDAVASRLLLRALAHASGVSTALFSVGLRDGADGALQVQEDAALEPLQALLGGQLRTVEFAGGQVVVDAPRRRRVYLPGSFNPLHDGHRRLLAAACKSAGGLPGCYEITVGHPDKGQLPLAEVQRRLQPFLETGTPIVVTQAPLYSDKAALFPKSIFAVGYDTAVRLVAPRYYGGNNGMLLSMASLHGAGCRVFVGGRVEDASAGDGAAAAAKFLTLADVDMPADLQKLGLFVDVPESDFREDISSTQLRKAAEGAAAS